MTVHDGFTDTPFSGKVTDSCGQCLLPTDSTWNKCLGCDGQKDSGYKLDSCSPPKCLLPSDPNFDQCTETSYDISPVFYCWDSASHRLNPSFEPSGLILVSLVILRSR